MAKNKVKEYREKLWLSQEWNQSFEKLGILSHPYESPFYGTCVLLK